MKSTIPIRNKCNFYTKVYVFLVSPKCFKKNVCENNNIFYAHNLKIGRNKVEINDNKNNRHPHFLAPKHR